MTGPPQNRVEPNVWHVPGRSPVILYTADVCEQIVARAFDALRGGGGETGGILFGHADDAEVKVTAFRPLRRELGGPFALTPAEHGLMQQLLQTSASEPDLRKLVPVGFYRVRVGGPLALESADKELWSRHFPFRWQVVLLLRIEEREPVRGGFFFRPPSGAAETAAPLLEFALEAPPPPAPETSLLPALSPRELFRIPAERGAGRAKWYALGALAALGAMAAGYHFGRNQPAAGAAAVLDAGLRLSEKDGFLTVQWKRGAAALQQVRDARLRIEDGNRRTDMALSDPVLATASWSIVRSHEDVRVAIMARTPGNEPVVVQSARFVGPVATRPTPPEGAAATEGLTKRERARYERLKRLLERQLKANKRHEENLERALQAAEARSNAAGPAEAGAKPVPKPAAVQTPPAPEAPPPKPAVASPQPSAPPAQPVSAAPPPPPVRLPAPEPVQYAGPSSGRIIWTGHLPANSTLTIDGRRASAGSLSAALPPVPARVTIHPAEITGAGLTLFTASPARGNTTEARSARNGWMATSFIHDAVRAQDARLAEPPSAAAPQKVVIRSGDRAVSAVVIDWQVVQ